MISSFVQSHISLHKARPIQVIKAFVPMSFGFPGCLKSNPPRFVDVVHGARIVSSIFFQPLFLRQSMLRVQFFKHEIAMPSQCSHEVCQHGLRITILKAAPSASCSWDRES